MGLSDCAPDLLDVFQADRKGTRRQQSFTHDILQLPHVARPGLGLKPGQGVGLDGGRPGAEVFGVAIDEEPYQLGDVLRTFA